MAALNFVEELVVDLIKSSLVILLGASIILTLSMLAVLAMLAVLT